MLDLISVDFARQHKLQQASATAPILRAVGALTVPQHGVYKVPITATDSRGQEKQLTLLCVAIDKDPNTQGSPVLIGMHTLAEQRIHLATYSQEWWYENRKDRFSLLTPQRFAKKARNEAIVYVLTAISNDSFVPLGDEEIAKGYGSIADIPVELQGFEDVFALDKAGLLPPHKDTDHSIDLLPGTTPPHGPIYPLSQAELQELWEYIADSLAKGRIRPSKSPAGAPILFVPKKDGTLRLCVDYRGLNKVTEKNRYALPLISEILDRCQGAKYFTKIDIKDAYYRIRIKEGDEWKTAFRTRYGHYEYLVMPFGLTNAPATFQSYIHQALHGLLDTICVVYLDDILIFSKTREEHTAHIQRVLERMRAAELYAKPSKCSFYQDSVEFLGFILSIDGISMDPRRVTTVAEWKEPTTYREVQVFLGFCNFYRRFIQGYSAIAAPLNALLKGSKNGTKSGEMDFGHKERQAFNQLKAAFKEAPLLRHYKPGLPVRIETDASNFAMAGIISQPDKEGRYHPVAFWSRKFTDAERNYGTPDQELFAIVESFKHWRHYVEGVANPVEVLSDHHNLQTFMRQEKLNGRQARWCMFLSPFHFVIKHRAGKTNPADGPSRRPDYESEPITNRELLPDLQKKLVPTHGVEELPMHRRRHGDTLGATGPVFVKPTPRKELPDEELLACVASVTAENMATTPRIDQKIRERVGVIDTVTAEEVRRAIEPQPTYYDELAKPLIEILLEAQSRDTELQSQFARETQPKCRRKSGVWTRTTSGLILYNDRVVVPREPALRQELMRLYHDDPLAGHFGIERTTELLQRNFYWTYMRPEVRDHVASCGICQGVVARRHRPYGSLESLPIPRRPWVEISMDFITGLPVSHYNGRDVDSILVIVDRFTKYSIFLPVMTTINAADLAELFHKEIELRFGAPEGIISDRGPIFTSQFWADLCYLSKIKRRLSTAFHPQTDGQTERINQTIEHYLRCFIGDNQVIWPQLLPQAQYACNNAVSSTTGQSPHYALMGYEPQFRLSLEAERQQEEAPNASARIQKLHQVREQLKDNWRKATETQAKYYNKRHVPLTLRRGDLVGLATKNLRVKEGKRKLIPRYIGPLRILETIGKQAYRLALPEKYSRLHNVFHISLLEPWNRRSNERKDTLPMPDLADEDDEYEVEEVKDQKQTREGDYYLVKWKGWPSEYNQWLPAEDMENAPQAIAAFKKQKSQRITGEKTRKAGKRQH